MTVNVTVARPNPAAAPAASRATRIFKPQCQRPGTGVRGDAPAAAGPHRVAEAPGSPGRRRPGWAARAAAAAPGRSRPGPVAGLRSGLGPRAQTGRPPRPGVGGGVTVTVMIRTRAAGPWPDSEVQVDSKSMPGPRSRVCSLLP
jgi:hypothetical protein